MVKFSTPIVFSRSSVRQISRKSRMPIEKCPSDFILTSNDFAISCLVHGESIDREQGS